MLSENSDSDGLIESPDKPLTALQAYRNENSWCGYLSDFKHMLVAICAVTS
jgi:hypothetical protein